MGKKPLRALIIEDSEDDSLLLLRELRRGEYDVVHKRVETPEAMRQALAERPWDVIISDYVLPKFSGLAALTVLKESGQDLPFIIVSGNIGEDIAVGAMRAGAHDYIIKGNLTRLVPAVERELRDAESRRERRRAEEQLLQSRRKLLTTLENMNEGFFTLDQEWRFTYVNAEAARLWEKNPDEILGRTFWDVVPNAVGTIFETEYRRAVDRQVPVWFETTSPMPETWVEVRAYPSADGLAVYFHDITERKRSEELISRLNRLYSVLSKVNETIVRTRDPKELYDKVCRIAVENGAFRMAWIGMTDPGTRRVIPVASAGEDGGYLTDLAIIAADVPEGKGPTGKAALLGVPFICRDIEHDAQIPWRDKALQCGLRSAAAFPLRTASAVIGAFTVYADSPHFFTNEEMNLLASLADDISFAIDSLANEKRRLEVEKELRDSQGSLAKAQSIAHLGSWSMDLKSGKTVWSEELYRIFGISPAAFAGDVRNILTSIVHPDDRDNVLKRFDQITQENVISPLEYRIVLPDGSLRVVRSEGEMVFDLSRKAMAAIGTVQDITERWETENRIKVTNSLLALYTQKTDRQEYLDAAVRLILAWSGCHHCGVRIVKRDNTVPFESCANYTDAFLEKEASFSLAEGSCICNRVAAGTAEPEDLPAMTPQGSFYSNDTQQFFDGLSPAEKAKYRGHCLQSGFVSLAIIPIRHRETMIGAIHLADDNSGMVPRQKVEFVEYLSQILGEAIYRFGIEDDLRKNYDALRESEARYRTLFQDVRDVIFTVTPDGFITSLNPAFETITGIPREQVVGQYFSIVIHPDDLAFATTILRKALDGEPIPLFELRTRTRAEEYRYLEFKITSERREDGSILGIARDVTERKKAERALRLANAYNRSLLEASLDPLVTIGADGSITDVNMATEAATGFVRSELIGTDFSNYFTEPDKAQQGYQRVFREGKVMDYALEIRHRDGGVTPVLYNASLYRDENDNVLGVFAAARDVTELREGERRNTVINNLLQLFAQSYSRKDYMDQAANVIRSWSRCESVGMRILDQEGNIPYVTCIGFDSNFVESESRISLTRDHCACTRVVAEQPDPLDASVMTANGSLFYNNAVKFVRDLPDEKKKHFRGVCQQSGFNSVAVIPLRYRNKVLGAIHLADARENMFPLPVVEFLERTALIIGEAIYRFGIEEEQVRLASALESSADAIIITDPEHGIIQYVNSAFESITG